MAKLTNKMMEVLSERAVDILEEKHKASQKNIIDSEEYANFVNNYDLSSDETAQKINEFSKKCAEFEALGEALKEEAKKLAKELDIHVNTYHIEADSNKKLLKTYLKNERDKKYQTKYFNREKMLRQIQADILLSEVGNPEQLVNQVVKTYDSESAN